ncbi:hypothetical protein P1P68_00865 [Streptomyces scabiei]|nr:hypothetical protein [Streptomyces scabiei]MDW8803396.1 hypothetical protein [Streptomyces scabiei]
MKFSHARGMLTSPSRRRRPVAHDEPPQDIDTIGFFRDTATQDARTFS